MSVAEFSDEPLTAAELKAVRRIVLDPDLLILEGMAQAGRNPMDEMKADPAKARALIASFDTEQYFGEGWDGDWDAPVKGE